MFTKNSLKILAPVECLDLVPDTRSPAQAPCIFYCLKPETIVIGMARISSYPNIWSTVSVPEPY